MSNDQILKLVALIRGQTQKVKELYHDQREVELEDAVDDLNCMVERLMNPFEEECEEVSDLDLFVVSTVEVRRDHEAPHRNVDHQKWIDMI